MGGHLGIFPSASRLHVHDQRSRLGKRDSRTDPQRVPRDKALNIGFGCPSLNRIETSLQIQVKIYYRLYELTIIQQRMVDLMLPLHQQLTQM